MENLVESLELKFLAFSRIRVVFRNICRVEARNRQRARLEREKERQTVRQTETDRDRESERHRSDVVKGEEQGIMMVYPLHVHNLSPTLSLYLLL